jgi:uncharacterized paraquat-inducible protein A
MCTAIIAVEPMEGTAVCPRCDARFVLAAHEPTTTALAPARSLSRQLLGLALGWVGLGCMLASLVTYPVGLVVGVAGVAGSVTLGLRRARRLPRAIVRR